jgi:VCBS repeat-containing protein
VDTGETAQLVVHNLLAVKSDGSSAGTVTDNADGTFTFHPAADYNGAVSFNYDVQDPQGASVSTSASLQLAAVSDAAVIGGVDTGSVTEATADADMSPDYAHPGMGKLGNVPLYADGKLTISDPDAGEANFDTKGTGYNYHGQYGYLLLNEDGAWHYYADAGNIAGVGGRHTQHGTAIDQLGDGQSLTDTITVYSKDGTAHDIVITIHGSNDKPYCSSDVVLQNGTEDTTQTLTTAQLLASTVDVDANDAGKLSIANVRVDHGSIRDNQDGTYTFTPARDYNGGVHFNYDVQDTHGGVTHTGATTSLAAVSDAAVITGTGAHLKEDVDLGSGTTAYNKIGTSGQFHVTDPDGPSESQFPDVLQGGIYIGNLGGKLQVNSNGNYFYGIENKAVNHLAEGQEARETFTIHSVDGTTHQVEFVIEGTNDAPYVRGAAALSSGIEDTSVTLHVADLLAQAGDYDDGETAQLSVHNLSADHGTITDNKDGTYTFTPEANYNGAVSFTYDVQDPQGATVAASASMTLAAVADTPVLNVDITNTADNVLNASEAGAATISGALDPSVASTLDRIDITDGTTTVTVDKANITVAADGMYQTTADLSSLKDGSLTVTAHATSHDGTTATATDTITKDASTTITANLTSTSDTGSSQTDHFTKDNAPTIEGQAEAGAQVVITDAQGRVVGQGQADATGHYAITTAQLPDDHSMGTTLTITSTDAAGNSASVDQTLYITTHLPPLQVIGIGDDTGIKGDFITQFHGAGSNLRIDQKGMDPTAHIEYSLDGGQSWSTRFTPQDGLNDFQVRQVDLAGNTSMGTPVRYTIDNTVAAPNVDLVNDSGSSSSDLITQNGSLNVAGTEAGATVEYSLDGQHWSTAFTPQEGANNVQVRQTDVAGNVSAASHISFRLDTAATVHDNSANMNEDQPGIHGNLIVDDEVGVQVTGGLGEQQGSYGKFVIHADGSYTYTPDARAQALSLNEHQQETFTFTVTDKAGNTATETFQITLTGRNDGPVITGDTSGQVTEDGPKVAVSGVLATQDPDAGESSSLTPLNNQAGQYGHLTLQADGHWVYTLDNANANVQDLKQGQTVQETFVVTAVSNDGTHTTQTLTIDVEGSADAPVLHQLSDSGQQHSGPIEGNIITGLGTDQGASAAATDSDSNANLVLHDIQVHDTNAGRYVTVTPGNPYTMAGVGTLEIAANGHYSFTPEPGFTGKAPSMVYRVADIGGGSAAGESSQNELEIDVTPGHMGPATLAALTGGGSSMFGTLVSASGVTGGWAIQDPGTGASTHAHHGQYGSLSIDPNTGMVSYHVDGGPQGVQKTGTGVTGDVVEHFVITQGGTATTQVEVDVLLSAVSTHGHSGHYVQHITVKDLDASALPNVQHDEPDPIDDQSDIQTVMLDIDGSYDVSPQHDFSRLDALQRKNTDVSEDSIADERAAKVFASAADNEADDVLQNMVSSHLAEHDASKKVSSDPSSEQHGNTKSEGEEISNKEVGHASEGTDEPVSFDDEATIGVSASINGGEVTAHDDAIEPGVVQQPYIATGQSDEGVSDVDIFDAPTIEIGGVDLTLADTIDADAAHQVNMDSLDAIKGENGDNSGSHAVLGNDYSDIFHSAGAELHDSYAAMTDVPDANPMAETLVDHGAILEQGSGGGEGLLDPATMADFLDQQDQVLNPDSDANNDAPLPDPLDDSAADASLDDPSLYQRDDHHQ